MTKGSNRRRILFSVILVIEIVLLTVLMAYLVHKQAENQCWERINDAITAVNSQFSEKMEGERNSITNYASYFNAVEDFESPDVLERVKNGSIGVTQAPTRIFLPDGRVITENETVVQLDRGERYERFNIANAFYFSTLERDVFLWDQMVVNVVCPIRNAEKGTTGIVVKSIPYQKLMIVSSATHFDRQMYVSVMDRKNGQLIFDTGHDGVPGRAKTFLEQNPPVEGTIDDIEKMLENKETQHVIIRDGETGERNYLYFMPSNAFDWIIAAYVPEKVAFAESQTILHTFGIFGLVEVIILAVYLLWITKDTMAQVEKVVLQERLIKAEKAEVAKTTFLFNMSHDIRTPMNAILGYTEIAQRHMDDAEKVEDCLEKIDISGKHLMEIINDVLDMSRIESGHVTIDETPMDVIECANETIFICKSLATSRDITLALRTENITEPKVYGDLSHVNEILINIISNAIKYTENGGKVTMTVSQTGTDQMGTVWFDFVIVDNGIGMSEEFLSHIFDAFEREKNSTVSGIQGTGLGMAIVNNLVDLLGGFINIQSKKGEGTTVSVSLPFIIRSDDEVEDDYEEELIEDGKAFENKHYRVLLVEDNEMNREIAKAILTESGIEVEEAYDGDIAVAMVSGSKVGYYNAVLMDVQMPRMNGYMATRAIRQLENKELAGIPIIAMTANAFEEDKKKAREAGMDAHIAKPIDVKKLLLTLHQFQ